MFVFFGLQHHLFPFVGAFFFFSFQFFFKKESYSRQQGSQKARVDPPYLLYPRILFACHHPPPVPSFQCNRFVPPFFKKKMCFCLCCRFAKKQQEYESPCTPPHYYFQLFLAPPFLLSTLQHLIGPTRPGYATVLCYERALYFTL